MTGTIIEIVKGEVELKEILERSDKFVLVDYYIQGCGPCNMLAVVLKEMVIEYNDRVIIVKMDAEATPENEQWAEDQDIEGFPWVHLYNPKGEIVCDDLPFCDKEHFTGMIDDYLKEGNV